jgi:hypothetical protein
MPLIYPTGSSNNFDIYEVQSCDRTRRGPGRGWFRRFKRFEFVNELRANLDGGFDEWKQPSASVEPKRRSAAGLSVRTMQSSRRWRYAADLPDVSSVLKFSSIAKDAQRACRVSKETAKCILLL